MVCVMFPLTKFAPAIIKNQIMRKIVTMLLCAVLAVSQLAAQNRTVKGKVQDDKGAPVANASILVKGSTLGTSSAADGTFSITVPASARTLVISSLNFAEQQVSIVNKTNILVGLEPSAQNLQEVVVVGYGTQRKSTSTGAIARVGGDKVENVPLPSVDQILQGKVAGLQSVTSNGQPGANQQIRIRGINSYSASAQPLYVVDGIQINSGDLTASQSTSNVLATLNSNDIEDITVLKDAASTSLYGSRGSNGVILITTKRGRAGKAQLRFDAEAGQTAYANVPAAGKPLRAADWFSLLNEGLVNAGYNAATVTSTMNAYGYGNGVDVDWLGLVTQTGSQQQYNMSMTTGDAKTQLFLSGGYFKQEGANIGSALRRISGNIKLTHNISNKLSVTTNWNIGSVYQNTPLSGSGYFSNPLYIGLTLRPTQNPYNADGSLNIGTDNLSFPSHYNALYTAKYDKIWLKNLQAIGGAQIEYKIVNGLKFTSHIGIQYNNLEEFNFNNPFHGDGKSYGGYSNDYYTRYFLWDWYNQFDYHLNLLKNKDLTADFKLGYEAISNSTYRQSSVSQSYPPTSELPYSVNAATALTGNATAADYTFASVYSTANFVYKNKYSLYASFRNDGSSRFGSTNRYGSFPAVGASWNIMQESFMQDSRLFSGLKLRASYGSAGNAGIGNYAWRQLYGYGYNYNGAAGGTFNTIGNVDLTWEKTKQLDIGVDLGFFKNRLNVVADYYNKESDGLLFAKPISTTTGFSSITSNIGTIRNRGWELTINATPIVYKDFSWDLSFNISHNVNTVISLPNHADVANGSFRLREGRDIQSWYLKANAGVDPATGAQLWYVDSSRKSTTNNYANASFIFLDKSASPTYFGSLGNTFTWKGFSIGADFYYNYGNYVQDGYGTYFTGGQYPTRGKYAVNLTRWQKPGDITTIPKYVYGQTNVAVGERLLYRGDYIRLRNITIGYKVTDKKVLSKIGMSSLNVYARGTNLWTKTYDPTMPIDPEQGVAGQDAVGLLIAKTITFGLNIGF